MNTKNIPFTTEDIRELTQKGHPTPFYIYDEEGIRNTAKRFNQAFSWNPGFLQYYAVKALPNPVILKVIKEEGMGVDVSSLAELELVNKVGFKGEEILMTANNVPQEEYARAYELGGIINLDYYEYLEDIQKLPALPEILCFRYTPEKIEGGNEIIGLPLEAKFGMTKEQIEQGIEKALALGIKRIGIHAMLASNDLSVDQLGMNAEFLLRFVKSLNEKFNITIEFLNLGGGIGIPYKPEDEAFNLEEFSDRVKKAYEALELTPLKIFMECGRFITGPHGYLVASVRTLKTTYRNYAGLDASMPDLMRPGMYDAYHHISVLTESSEVQVPDTIYDVVGSLCENNDKFAKERLLPKLHIDDILVFHDAGAHAHAMGFNYNGKLRPAEFLMHNKGDSQKIFTLIRRAETLDDYFSTLAF